MREPIDDERVRRMARVARTMAAAASAGLGAGAVVGAVGREPIDPVHAWVVAWATVALAWWAAPRRPNDVVDVFLRPAFAGSVVGLVSALILARVLAILCVSAGVLAGMTLGMVVSIRASWVAIRGARPVDPPGEVARDALVVALVLAPGVVLERVVPGFGLAAGAIAVAGLIVAIAAKLEQVRRRAFVRSVEAGALAGWRAEPDERGSRWLVREAPVGDGAYRGHVVSTRWARA